jgi:hypothetical protein
LKFLPMQIWVCLWSGTTVTVSVQLPSLFFIIWRSLASYFSWDTISKLLKPIPFLFYTFPILIEDFWIITNLFASHLCFFWLCGILNWSYPCMFTFNLWCLICVTCIRYWCQFAIYLQDSWSRSLLYNISIA